jgi:hypothetical protein
MAGSSMFFLPDSVVELLLSILPLLLLVFLPFAICALWKMMRTQNRILTALETANKINIEMLRTLKGVGDSPESAEVDDSEPETEDESETPADFVYCPECSTRVEVDPTIRNINVVCPDCKKPFHIH